MKRLKLEVFKAKNIGKEMTQQVDQLLGQVLGDCHDSNRVGDGSSGPGGADKPLTTERRPKKD